MGKQTIVLNFDGAITPENKFVFYESGPGLIRVGYHIDEEIKNRALTKEKIIIALFEFYDHIYIVSPLPRNEMFRNFGVSETFYNTYEKKLSLCTLEQLISRKASLNQNGAIIAVTESIPMGQPFHYTDVLNAEGIHLPVVNDSAMFRIFYEKTAMNEIFHRHSPKAVPQEVIINFDALNSTELAVSQLKSEYVVLKPIDGTRACGVVLVPKKQANEVLTWLADTNPFKMLKQMLPKLEDSESQDSLVQLDAKITETGIRYCIAQECITPALLEVKGSKFRPTVRPVVVAHYDSETDKLSIRVPEIYYKLPTTPVSSEKLLWDETISYHRTNCAMESTSKNILISTISKGKLEKLKKKEKYPYTVVLDQELYNIIASDIVSSLAPVVSYLFKTNVDTYYAQVFKQKNNFSIMCKSTLRLCIHRNLDENLCKLFKNENLNVPQILLYHLYYRIKFYQHLKYKSILQPHIMTLLLRYQTAFGNVADEEIIEISKLILKNIDDLEVCGLSNELKILKENLQNYSEGKLNLQNAEQVYLNACAMFKEGNISLATALFIHASLICSDKSKEQATCFYSLASCYIKQDYYEKALEFAEKATELRTELFKHKDVSGDDLERASKKLKDAKTLVAADKKAQIGLALFKKENYAEAIKEFEAAIELYKIIQPKSTRLALYHYNLASSYLRLDLVRHAIKQYEQSYVMRVELLGEDHEMTKNTQRKLAEANLSKQECAESKLTTNL